MKAIRKFIVTVSLGRPGKSIINIQAETSVAIIASGIKFEPTGSEHLVLSSFTKEDAGVVLFVFHSREYNKTVERKLGAQLPEFGLLSTIS